VTSRNAYPGVMGLYRFTASTIRVKIAGNPIRDLNNETSPLVSFIENEPKGFPATMEYFISEKLELASEAKNDAIKVEAARFSGILTF